MMDKVKAIMKMVGTHCKQITSGEEVINIKSLEYILTDLLGEHECVKECTHFECQYYQPYDDNQIAKQKYLEYLETDYAKYQWFQRGGMRFDKWLDKDGE